MKTLKGVSLLGTGFLWRKQFVLQVRKRGWKKIEKFCNLAQCFRLVYLSLLTPQTLNFSQHGQTASFFSLSCCALSLQCLSCYLISFQAGLRSHAPPGDFFGSPTSKYPLPPPLYYYVLVVTLLQTCSAQNSSCQSHVASEHLYYGQSKQRCATIVENIFQT